MSPVERQSGAAGATLVDLDGPAACERSRGLLAESEGGSTLSRQARAALKAHLRICADCRSEWAMETLLPLRHDADCGPALSLSPSEQDRFVAAVLAGARAEEPAAARGFGLRRMLDWFGLAAGAAAVAVFAWLVAVPALQQLGAPTVGADGQSGSGFSVAAVSGDVRIDGAAATQGAPLAADAILETGPGASVAVALSDGSALVLAPDSRLSLRPLSSTDAGARLVSGRVLASVAPQPAGRTFSVDSPRGRAEVVGTAFAVDTTSGSAGEVELRVLEGTVRVDDGAGSTRLVKGGRAGAVGAATPLRRLGADEIRADAALAALAPEIDATLQERLAASTGGSRGRKGSSATRRGSQPSASSPDAAGRGSAMGTLAEAPRREETPLDRARALRAARDWEGAAAAYRAIIDDTPDSGAAQSARIALGQLSNGRLARPADALPLFDEYLRRAPSGALAEEALWGRARALGKLGRHGAERAALEELLDRFPSGSHARKARQKLSR